MSEYLIQSETLTALGDKIRSITGSSEQMTPAQMVSALDNITGGLSGSKDRIEGYRDSDKTIEQVLEICPPAIMDISEIPDSFYDYKSLSLPLVTSIHNSLFSGSEIASVNLPACTLIGEGAFQGCLSLSSLNIPMCQSVGQDGFKWCDSLTTLNMPMCQSVGHSGFYECESLATVTLPVCDSIDSDGFADCAYLVSADIPACISLASYAFQNCSALEDIYLNSACVIEDYAFDGVLDPDNKTFRMHFTGVSLPSSYGTSGGKKLFGNLSGSDDGGSGSGSEPSEQSISNQPIPGLEIYVPANMLDEFKTSWCGGFYANNIFAEPAVDA